MEVVSLPYSDKLVIVEALDYRNTYNHLKPHRHDYFEIIFICEGAGLQYIDFERFELKAGEVYIICPGQVHLMKRSNAMGLILQFPKTIFDVIFPLKHHQLHLVIPKIEVPKEKFIHLYNLSSNILRLLKTTGLPNLSLYKAYSYLQIVLISLIEEGKQKYATIESDFASHFIYLINQNVRQKRKVSEYAIMMCCSVDKLTILCKRSFGKTPLKMIHEELLHEIRRMMILNQLSIKEMTYEFNFDSVANFSAFIKAATSQTPTQLQKALLESY